MRIFPPGNRRCAIANGSISASRCRWSDIWDRPASSRRWPSTPSDLGLVPIQASASGGAWWAALEADTAPKIIARLPFVEREDHPAGLPVFAIARPHPDAVVTDVAMWSLRVAGWGARPAQALASLAEAVVVPDRGFDGAALLIPVPQGQSLDDILSVLVGAGVSVRGRALVGSHAQRYMVGADSGPTPAGR